MEMKILIFCFLFVGCDAVVRLVIDTDAASDDIQALTLALRHPDVEVVAITTVAGAVDPLQAVANVARTIRGNQLSKEIPIFKGGSPLIGNVDTVNASIEFFGNDGLSDRPDVWPKAEPGDRRSFQKETAADALIRLFRESPGQLTLVALGPLTNIALALATEPGFAKWPKRVVVTGGNYYAMGNVKPQSTAEFNFNADPEAAFAVLRQMRSPMTIVTWETFFFYQDIYNISFDFMRHLSVRHSPLSHYFLAITEKPRAFMGHFGLPLRYGDEVTVGVAIDPEGVATRRRNASVSVELRGEFTRGQMVVAWADLTFGNSAIMGMHKVELVMDYDVERLDRMIIDVIKPKIPSRHDRRTRALRLNRFIPNLWLFH